MLGLELAYATRTVLAPGQTGAGTGVSVPVPESEIQMLLAVSFRIVTSAAVATRTPFVQVTDGTGVAIATAVSGVGTTATSTADYSFAYGVTEWDFAGTAVTSGPLMALVLDAGDSIVIGVNGMDAADQVSRVRITLAQSPRRDDD